MSDLVEDFKEKIWVHKLSHSQLSSPIEFAVIDGEPFVADHSEFAIGVKTSFQAEADGVRVLLDHFPFFPVWWLAENGCDRWDWEFLRRQLLAAYEAGERSPDKRWAGKFSDLGIHDRDSADGRPGT